MIHLVFPGPEGDQKVVSLAFAGGRSLRDYLRDHQVRRHGMIGRFTRMRTIDQNHRILRLNSVLIDGATVYFQRTARG